eukprot:8719493-Lingulodinium_polyedra.AAC.1
MPGDRDHEAHGPAPTNAAPGPAGQPATGQENPRNTGKRRRRHPRKRGAARGGRQMGPSSSGGTGRSTPTRSNRRH